MKKFTKQEILELYGQVTMGEISFSSMVEVINRRVSDAADIPEELKKGDLAIFWEEKKKYATIRIYDQSKEQYERLIKGEI